MSERGFRNLAKDHTKEETLQNNQGEEEILDLSGAFHEYDNAPVGELWDEDVTKMYDEQNDEETYVEAHEYKMAVKEGMQLVAHEIFSVGRDKDGEPYDFGETLTHKYFLEGKMGRREELSESEIKEQKASMLAHPHINDTPSKGFRFEKTEHLKEDIMKRLEEGVRPLFETEQYKEYLKTVSRFHDYSFNNTILIVLQQPDATFVAGFNKWKELGRSVNKGETGIKIIACGEKKTKGTDEKGKEKEDIQRYFFPVTVFDIAQTSGKELTLNPFEVHRLDGTVEKFEALRDALIKTAGCPVIFEPMKKDGPLGFFSRQTKDIHISESLSPAQTINVLVHEIEHAKLHDDLEQIKARDANKSTREVEAESVSFVVCERLGLDTSQNSFGYIAGWSKDKELPELKKSLQIIADTSRAISDQVLEQLTKNQKKTQRENLACRKK